jgi:hypothetical protein
MSTPGENDSARSSHQRGASECKPLIHAATKELFRKNAFRITGLSVDATTREAAKHADKLKMLAELGQDPHTQGAAFPMKPPPSLDEIREAVQKLKDPEKRLIDEFFWFWPVRFGQSQSDPAIQALVKGDSATAVKVWSAKTATTNDGYAATHNLAVFWYLEALEWENNSLSSGVDAKTQGDIKAYWRQAFQFWKELIRDDGFWETLTARIRQINEPTLPTGFARRMRLALPEAFHKISAELALAFAESDKIEIARFHVQFMRETNQGLARVEKTAELVLAPARNRLKEQIQRAKDGADKNPKDAVKAAHELLDQIRQTLAMFDLFFGDDNELRNELFDEVASACNRLQVIYHDATSDDEPCLAILNLALPLATAVELRHQIEKNIGALSGFMANKRLEPLYTRLKSIQDSNEHPRVRLDKFNREMPNIRASGNAAVANLPYGADDDNPRTRLFDAAAIVLRGISLDAWNKHQDRQTAVAANTLALTHAVSAELKQKLTEDKATLQQIGVKISSVTSAQRTQANKKGAGCLVAIAVFVVLGIIGSCNSTNTPSSNSSYTPRSTAGGGDSSGSAYRVPSSASPVIDIERTEIESDRATVEALHAEVEKLGREIDSERAYLDSASQVSEDAFNEKVARYNELAQRAKTSSAAFNEKVDNYNAKLRQAGQ